MVQHHDSVPSLNCTAISIDSPHMHRDGANYLNLLLCNFCGQEKLSKAPRFKYFAKCQMGIDRKIRPDVSGLDVGWVVQLMRILPRV